MGGEGLNKDLYFSFHYDKRGYGYLEMINTLHHGEVIVQRWYARSGSCNVLGQLVNSIPVGEWYMVSKPQIPVISEMHKMKVEGKPGIGWKQRLWPIPVPSDHDPISHYLIHPDGNKPGTMGCIGLQNTNAKELYSFFLNYFSDRHFKILMLKVTNYKQEPKPKKKEGGGKMLKKETLKTKTFWLGLATMGWGIFQLATGNGGTEEIIAGLSLIFGRDAIAKIQ